LANPGTYPVYSSSAVGLGEFGRYGHYMFDDERITWSVDGGGRFFYRPPHKYSVTNVAGWLKILDPEVLSAKYLANVLIHLWATKTYNYTVKAHPSVIRQDYQIPVPPLVIQEEIVSVLEQFKELEAELEVHLDAELDARVNQFESIRSSLMDFRLDSQVTNQKNRDRHLDSGSVPYLELGQLVRIRNGKDYKHLKLGKYPVYGSGGVMTHVGEFAFDKPSVLIPRKGSLSNLFYVDVPFWTVDTIFWTEVGPEIEAKYLFYVLSTFRLEELNLAGGVPSLTQTMLNALRIPVPTKARQLEIIETLDHFSALIVQAKNSLPAEIQARRKQYEYYRNKLLTFKELDAA
jgi:type I restriction enzyme, S subunit